MKQIYFLGKCLLGLGLVFVLGQKLKSQDAIKYVELSAVEAIGNDHDLQHLNTYFKDVTLVGMGESTHGTREFFTMRHRMFKYLVEHHEFNTFFLEADYANCLRVNKYVHGADDVIEEAIGEIDMWPWETEEMVDLVSWMRAYNLENADDQLSFIGVDDQRYLENIEKMDRILKRYNLPTTDSVAYKRMHEAPFYLVSKTKDLEVYKFAWEEKRLVDIGIMSEDDKMIYNTLLRHLTQVISEKYKWEKRYDYRDRRMAENILFHLNQESVSKGFFWAHNGHIYNVATREGKKKEWKSAGGHLKHELGKQYISIGQDFDEGSFNAYYPDASSTNIMEGKAYTLGPIEVSRAPEGGFVSKYRYLKSPVFIDCSSLPAEESFAISFIEAAYNPKEEDNPKSFVRKNDHGRNAFDAIVLIQTTTATHLLK